MPKSNGLLTGAELAAIVPDDVAMVVLALHAAQERADYLNRVMQNRYSGVAVEPVKQERMRRSAECRNVRKRISEPSPWREGLMRSLEGDSSW